MPVVVLALMSCMLSCTPHRSCVDSPVHPAFTGFSAADIDSFILRAYQPNDNFQRLLDTFIVTRQFASIYTTSGDTTIVYINDSNPRHWIKPGFDWQLYIPSKNRTVHITNIKTTQEEGKGRLCYNPIHVLEMDGQLVTPELKQTSHFYTSGYMLYIRN